MAPTASSINVLCLCLIVPSFVYALVTQFWSLPLKNGPGFFLGVEVAPGFYEGPDSRWLRRYRAMVAAIYLLDFGALATLLAIRKWDWIPVWAGGTAVFFTASMMAFALWARHRVGASHPPVLRAALSLEPRRLGDYLWWPAETLTIAVVACSWWMLLANGGSISWQGPLSMTWVVLGLLPGKIIAVRQGWPLPAERTDEHRAGQEAGRRYSVRVLDAFGWFSASILFMGAVRLVWPAARTSAAGWLVIGIPLAFAVFLMVVVAGQKRVLDRDRTLRPAGSWAPPFGHATLMSRAGLVWFGAWFGGLMLLICLIHD